MRIAVDKKKVNIKEQNLKAIKYINKKYIHLEELKQNLKCEYKKKTNTKKKIHVTENNQ